MPCGNWPYSQAVKIGDMVFVSCQLPVDVNTGELDGSCINTQTQRSLENIVTVLREAGLWMEHVAKTTVFLQDMNDFSTMNEVYSTYFNAPYPTRSTVQVAALPKQALVEIEVIAQALAKVWLSGICAERGMTAAPMRYERRRKRQPWHYCANYGIE